MKIDLILSTNKSYRLAVEEGHKYSSFAPQTLPRLASLVPAELQAKIRQFDLCQERLPADLERSDLVGISTITCGAAYAYELADKLRAKGVTVVLGGTHPTALPAEAGQHADSIVVGYGEKTWPQLLRDYCQGALQARYTDFSDPFTSPPPRIPRNAYKGKAYFFKACLEHARGCPNTCDFCVVSSLNAGSIYRKSVKDTMDEIARLGKWVLFLDSNFTEDTAQVQPLWQAMRAKGIRWYAAGSLKFGSNAAAVRLAAECGCRGLLVGFESINAASLEGCHKDFNLPADYLRYMDTFHKHGISILGCFVFGFDHDTPEVFGRTVDLVQRAQIDMVRYAIATPLPGTRFYAQLAGEKRIVDFDWDHYDAEHVVFTPKRMRSEELYAGLRWAFRETYRLPHIRQRIRGHMTLTTLFGNIGFRNLAYTFDRSHRQPSGEVT